MTSLTGLRETGIGSLDTEYLSRVSHNEWAAEKPNELLLGVSCQTHALGHPERITATLHPNGDGVSHKKANLPGYSLG
jgi:hypothetical protein